MPEVRNMRSGGCPSACACSTAFSYRKSNIGPVVPSKSAEENRPGPLRCVTSGVAGRLWRKARLKFGISETTRSRSPCFQNSFSSRTWPAMIQADQPVHQHRHLRRSQRPAFLQHDVVDILHPDAGVFAENIQRIQDLLQVNQPDFPGPPLLLDHGFQRVRGGSVPASGIKEHKVKSFTL